MFLTDRDIYLIAFKLHELQEKYQEKCNELELVKQNLAEVQKQRDYFAMDERARDISNGWIYG